MANDIGAKIGIEGERDFKKSISEINQSFKVLGSEMKLVASQFDKNDRSAASLTSKNTVLNKEIEQQKDKITTLKAALDNAASSFGENDTKTKNWQIQLNKAQAELNGMERELKNNDAALNNVGKEFDDAEKQTEQFDRALKGSASTADNASGRFSQLGSVVGKIGAGIGVGIAAIGTAAIAAGKALSGMTVSASEYADEILTQSTVTGMSTKSLQAYGYAAGLIDTDLETVTKTLAKNVKSMSAAQAGSGAAAEAYKKLGVSVTDAHGNLKDGETVYWQSIDALGKISNETERDALAMQIFGKSAQDLNPLIKQGSAGFAELTKEAESMGAIMSTDSLLALGNFNDSLERLKSGAGAAKNALGMVLLPQLQLLADDGVSLIGDFTKGLNDASGDWGKISDVIGNTVGGIVDMVMKGLPDIIEVGLDIVKAISDSILENMPMIVTSAIEIVNTLLNGLIEAMPQLASGAVQLVLGFANAIIENLPELVTAAIEIVNTLIRGIADALPELIPAAIEAITTIVKSLYDNMPMLVEAALQLILGLAQGLLNAIPQLVAALPGIINSIINYIMSAIPQIIQAGIDLLTSLIDALPTIIDAIVVAIPLIVDGLVTAVMDNIDKIIQAGIDLLISLIDALPTIITTIVTAIPKIINGITRAFTDNLDKIIDAGIKVFEALIDALPQIIKTIAGAVPEIIGGLVTAFKDHISDMKDIGLDLIKGLWQGISDAGEWLWGKIKGFFGGVTDRIKNFFGINSPSKLFRDDIGKNLALGVGEGFDVTMKKVSNDMQKAIPTSFDVAAPTLYSRSAATGFSLTQNIYTKETSYAAQQREAAKQFRSIARGLTA